MRLQIVAGYLFLLVSSQVGAEIVVDPSLGSSERLEIEQEYFRFARELSEKFDLNIMTGSLKVSVGNTGRQLARYSNGTIVINSKRMSRKSVIRHEIAHFAFEKHCPTIKSPFLHEIFAILVSGDFRRLSSNDLFLLKRSARQYLLENRESKIGPKAQAAIARLLVNKQRREVMISSFKKILKTCNKSSNQTPITQEMISQFLGEPKISLGPINIAVIDGISGKKLYSRGNLDQKYPIGSILKPLVLAELPSIQRSIRGNAGLLWNCPNKESNRRLWDWPEALVKSCNGFFIDQEPKESELNSLGELLSKYGVIGEKFSMHELIGLSERIEMSPNSVLSLYRYMTFAYPGIIDVLEGTPRRGTLKSVDGRNWFIRNSVRLKTGTVRGHKGSPFHSWLMAIGPKTRSGRPSYMAVVHGRGHSAFSLLKELKSKLQGVLASNPENADVQILGLVPQNRVSFICSKGIKYSLGISGVVNLVDRGYQPQVEETIFCDQGPLEARFPLKNGKITSREYWGHLKRVPARHLDPVTPKRGVTKRRVLARRGSVFRLTTSMSHYVERVILSEFPLGSFETLKLLALAIKNNARFERHLHGPICDTTHCQVFNVNGDGVGSSIKRKVQRAIKEVSHLKLIDSQGKLPWIHFSLGGQNPWSSYRNLRHIENIFGVSNIVNIVASEGSITIRGDQVRSLKCEKFRNRLSLLSCPSKIRLESGDKIFFSGKGEGHGLGIKLRQADIMSRQGKNLRDLQKEFLPNLHIK